MQRPLLLVARACFTWGRSLVLLGRFTITFTGMNLVRKLSLFVSISFKNNSETPFWMSNFTYLELFRRPRNPNASILYWPSAWSAAISFDKSLVKNLKIQRRRFFFSFTVFDPDYNLCYCRRSIPRNLSHFSSKLLYFQIILLCIF